MKIAILNDTFDTLRSLPCFRALSDHQVQIWTDHVQDTDVLAERLRDVEAPCSLRLQRRAGRRPTRSGRA
jgi:D-3-phosphoglycerate dehydrogenase